MKKLITMRAALEDPELFGRPDIMGGPTWAAWRVVLIAALGEPLTDEERVIFTSLTGRACEPLELVDEVHCVIGRRGGKTRAASVLAAYFSSMVDHTGKLAPGERGTLPLMAASTQQASKAFSYIDGAFDAVPALVDEVASRTADTLRLANAIDIEVRPANFRTIRGITAPAAIADEIAFWMVEGEGSTNPDTEILAAIRPALATMGGPLIVISSPHARKGELYETWKRDFGPDGDPRILVVHADSKTMNPSLPDAVIARAYARDSARAAAEYGAQFRSDIEAFISHEMIAAITVPGRQELPPQSSFQYFAFADPAGGSGTDSMTLAIGHRSGEAAVLDRLVEIKPPFSPNDACAEFAAVLKQYRIMEITGDRYAAEWPRERFAAHGIQYVVSGWNRSQLYSNTLPAINSRQVELLDIPRLASQFVSLERRPSNVGRDNIDHPRNGHDDLANAVAGVVAHLLSETFFDLDTFIKANS